MHRLSGQTGLLRKRFGQEVDENSNFRRGPPRCRMHRIDWFRRRSPSIKYHLDVTARDLPVEQPARRVGDTEAGEHGFANVLRIVRPHPRLRPNRDRAVGALKTPLLRGALKYEGDALVMLEISGSGWRAMSI